MKKTLYTICFFICLATMTSCRPTISDYRTEIEDAVRFYIAASELLARHIIEDGDNLLVEECSDKFSLSQEKQAYKSILVEKKYEGNMYASEMLNYYNKASIQLTEPICEKDSDEETVWSFQEINSQINFVFSIDSNVWRFTANQEDLNNFSMRILSELDDDE